MNARKCPYGWRRHRVRLPNLPSAIIVNRGQPCCVTKLIPKSGIKKGGDVLGFENEMRRVLTQFAEEAMRELDSVRLSVKSKGGARKSED